LIVIDPLLDPSETGLIGMEYNHLTTTVGSLPSQRTSTQPTFAAAIVELLAQARVRAGDERHKRIKRSIRSIY
jgi:poly-gamma-glutamate system protein